MNERKELVKFIDGSEKEIIIKRLSYTEQRKLLGEHIRFGMKDDELSINKIDFFNLGPSTLRLAGVKVDLIEDGEGDRIFNKYFGDLIKGISGVKEKNSGTTSE